MVTAAMKLKDAYSLEEKLWPIYTAYSYYGFSSSGGPGVRMPGPEIAQFKVF